MNISSAPSLHSSELCWTSSTSLQLEIFQFKPFFYIPDSSHCYQEDRDRGRLDINQSSTIVSSSEQEEKEETLVCHYDDDVSILTPTQEKSGGELNEHFHHICLIFVAVYNNFTSRYWMI